MKTILIAVPTNKYIEPDTFKSIYDLKIPAGYTTTFQFFYGYQIDQIRNLIAHWATKFDYLFSVDSDIVLPRNTLDKLISHDKDIVTGIYIQRKVNQHILELYKNGRNIKYDEIKGLDLVEVDSCGFGCILIKSKVIEDIKYPQFVYKSAIDHKDTISEDTFFCIRARELGYKVYADPSIQCNHIGSYVHVVDSEPVQENPSIFRKLVELSNVRKISSNHVKYLNQLKMKGTNPGVVYDIGAGVLHWTREAVGVWNTAQYYAFDATVQCAELFDHFKVPHYVGLLSDEDGKSFDFYQNINDPIGNSYYKENPDIGNHVPKYSSDQTPQTMKSLTIDTVVKANRFPLPDMMKISVRGAELDILKGASHTLSNCKDIIIRIQHLDCNVGAPSKETVFNFMNSIGYKLIQGPFASIDFYEGEYHFRKV